MPKRKTKKRIYRKTKKKKMKGGGPRWDRARDSMSRGSDIAIQRGSAAIGRMRDGMSSTAQWLAGNAGFPDYLPIEDIETDEDTEPELPCKAERDAYMREYFPERFYIKYADILDGFDEHLDNDTSIYDYHELLSDPKISEIFELIKEYANATFSGKYEVMFDKISRRSRNERYDPYVAQWHNAAHKEYCEVLNLFIRFINNEHHLDELFDRYHDSAKEKYIRKTDRVIHGMVYNPGLDDEGDLGVNCNTVFADFDNDDTQFKKVKELEEMPPDLRRIINAGGLLGDGNFLDSIKYFIISNYIDESAIARYLIWMNS